MKNLLNKECHCHGVSGSCELQICRIRPAKLPEISAEIYFNAYRNARWIDAIPSSHSPSPLFYARKSINYCRSNHFFDYSGMKIGRECFSHQACEEVCCHRGYEILTEMKSIENCHCFFSWNIVNIQCQSCEKKITRMICT